jgi:hypothetical protein
MPVRVLAHDCASSIDCYLLIAYDHKEFTTFWNLGFHNRSQRHRRRFHRDSRS